MVLQDFYKISLTFNWILIQTTHCRAASLTSRLPGLPLLLCFYTPCPRCDLPPTQTPNYSLSLPQPTNRVTQNSSEPHYATELNQSVAESHSNRSQALFTDPSRPRSWRDPVHGYGLPTPTSGPMHSVSQRISAYREINLDNPHVLDAQRYARGFGCSFLFVRYIRVRLWWLVYF